MPSMVLLSFLINARARLSPTATIIHCLDGCGRSGALVTIEVLLMHLLRG
ncbi:unnamed protein product [Onchocerca flexuosa]|uniref:TYR_PHOSPHATASE_2 domain-containing protein n=1 Tax=Onchocerca flexuosa TaxID=387005 RepID=A0A183HSK0_9BILA|nr:unnamed protein product [Onchocerca flexuosa]